MPALDLDQAIVQLVSRGEVKVPPYPAVALRIDALLRQDDYGLDDLAALVASDPVPAADVLRCANSAMYSRGTPIAAVHQAVTRIGARETAKVALASGLGAHANAPGRLAALRRRVWLDSLSTALLCRTLAIPRGLAPEEGFAAGLLHDFGKVVAIACIEALSGSGDRVEPRSEEAWAEVVDRYHVELGIVMAARWDLPAVLSDVISLHHAGATAGAASPALVEAVVASDLVVALLRDRTTVTEEDLAGVPLLSPSERGAIAAALHDLPGFVASFDAAGAVGHGPASSARSLVAPPAPPARTEGPKPPPYEVTLTASGRTATFWILGMANTHFVLAGPVAMPENVLMQLTVKSDPPLIGFANVKFSWPEEGAYAMLVQPFAFTADQTRRWQAMASAASATW